VKRSISFILLLVLLMTGCSTGEENNASAPAIEQYSWQMTSVQSKEAEGQAIAYGPAGTSTLDTAVEIILSCSAEEGKLLLTDETNGNAYSGIYELTDTSQESVIYEVTIGETEGMAITSMTIYQDGCQIPTLIISLNDYALNFFADIE